MFQWASGQRDPGFDLRSCYFVLWFFFGLFAFFLAAIACVLVVGGQARTLR